MTSKSPNTAGYYKSQTLGPCPGSIGVHTIVPPHINVHGWCDVTSPSYKPELAAAILHYSAHADKGDHFEVCIATQEMCDAAWQYGHQSQIILDGTFGVCDCKLAQC